MDLMAMADGAGYAKSYEFERLEELLIGMEEVMEQPGPVFVLVKSGPGRRVAALSRTLHGRGMGVGPRHSHDAKRVRVSLFSVPALPEPWHYLGAEEFD